MRRFAIGLAVAVLVLGLADALAWNWTTARLARGLASWADARRAAGWQVSSARPVRAGFPFAADLVVPRFRVTLPDPAAPGRISWRAARLVLRVPPLLPLRVTVFAQGTQYLALPGRPALRLHAAVLAATLRLDLAGRPRALSLRVQVLTADPAGVAPGLGIAALRARLVTRTPTRHDLTLAARGIVLPRTRRWPLGRRIARVAMRARLTGALPRYGSRGRLAAWLGTWQRDHGQVRIAHAVLHWGPLAATGTARLDLDAALRPAGTGRLTLAGYAHALDTLAANGALNNDTARTAKAVLSLLAPATPGAPVTIPLTLSDGRFNVLGIALIRLPPLARTGG